MFRCDYTTYVEKPALEHNEVEHEAKEPNCTEIGWSSYVTCSRCDYTTYAELQIKHNEVKHESQTPTCTEIGWSDYVTCSNCEHSTYSEIEALGHTFNNENTCARCMFYADEGVIFKKNIFAAEYIVVNYVGNESTIIIPSTYNGLPVKRIGNSAFKECSSIENIIISNGVEIIEPLAFYKCSNLKNITIPNSIEEIRDAAFTYCFDLTNVYINNVSIWLGVYFWDYFANPLYYAENLYVDGVLITNLVIPDDITYLKGLAFRNFQSLTSVTIPKNVTKIDGGFFYGCENLKTINYLGSEEEWKKITVVFDNYNFNFKSVDIIYNYGSE